MATEQDDAVPKIFRNPVWVGASAVLLLLVVVVLFFTLASHRLRHNFQDEAAPGGSVPGNPGQVVAH